MLKIRLSIALLVAACLLGSAGQSGAAVSHATSTPDVATNAASAAVAAASSAAAAASAATAAASAASACASAATGHAASALVPLPELTAAFVALFFLAGVLLSIRSLNKDGKWSLAKALSEKDTGTGTGTGTGGTGSETQPTASASRLIAFLGSIGLLAMIMGFGFYALWAFFNDKTSEAKDALQAASSYFLYGSAMYAPYAFNQIKSAFKS